MTQETQASSKYLKGTGYQRRRLRDAAKLLPVLGIILWLVPLLWLVDADAETGNARAALYIFGVWVVLILLAAGLSRLLRSDEPPIENETAD